MKQRFCQCGREIPINRYSTIQAKKCPSCTYADAVSKKNNRKTKSKTNQFDFYKTTAWKWFRRYVLLYYANKDGIVKCATSGRYMALGSKNCHCGHYIKVRDGNSTNYATALDFRNVGPQHIQDNTKMGGRQDLMREWLVNQHGEESIKNLESKRRIPFKLNPSTLEEYSVKYKQLFKSLLLDRNMKNPWN